MRSRRSFSWWSSLALIACVGLGALGGCDKNEGKQALDASSGLPLGATTSKPPRIDPAKLPGAPPVGDVVTTASGLQFYDLVPGTGAEPAGKRTGVTVNYTGWLEDGSEFENSAKKGGPAEYRLDKMIAGWAEGVGSMKVGGKRKLIIPPKLAWGARGRPGIPGGATVIFDVELLAVDD